MLEVITFFLRLLCTQCSAQTAAAARRIEPCFVVLRPIVAFDLLDRRYDCEDHCAALETPPSE